MVQRFKWFKNSNISKIQIVQRFKWFKQLKGLNEPRVQTVFNCSLVQMLQLIKWIKIGQGSNDSKSARVQKFRD